MKDRKKYLKRHKNRYRDDPPELAVAAGVLALFSGIGNIYAEHKEPAPELLLQIDAPFTDYEEVK